MTKIVNTEATYFVEERNDGKGNVAFSVRSKKTKKCFIELIQREGSTYAVFPSNKKFEGIVRLPIVINASNITQFLPDFVPLGNPNIHGIKTLCSKGDYHLDFEYHRCLAMGETGHHYDNTKAISMDCILWLHKGKRNARIACIAFHYENDELVNVELREHTGTAMVKVA